MTPWKKRIVKNRTRRLLGESPFEELLRKMLTKTISDNVTNYTILGRLLSLRSTLDSRAGGKPVATTPKTRSTSMTRTNASSLSSEGGSTP